MNRRGFLGAMLAACAAPAIVRAESIMRIAAPQIILPPSMLIASAAPKLTVITGISVAGMDVMKLWIEVGEGEDFIITPRQNEIALQVGDRHYKFQGHFTESPNVLTVQGMEY